MGGGNLPPTLQGVSPVETPVVSAFADKERDGTIDLCAVVEFVEGTKDDAVLAGTGW
jgi:hypothetical protein